MPALRDAQPADAAALATFARTVFEETYGSSTPRADLLSYMDEAFSAPVLGTEIVNPSAAVILAQPAGSSGTVAGYAHVRFGVLPVGGGYNNTGADASEGIVQQDDWAEIKRFYIGAAWQGTGLAQRLLSAALTRAAERGAHNIWLAVWEGNQRAFAFYEKHGFRHVGTRQVIIGSDLQIDLLLQTHR